jgi:outer membrane protein assembly factor BamE (lipoprotein component of BamABCDE complex)
MKKIGLTILALLMLALALSACDSTTALLQGNWVDDQEITTMVFAKDGAGTIAYLQFPLPMTYTVKNDVLTVRFDDSEQFQSGKITFYGDHEFYWEVQDNGEGEIKTQHYTRKVTQ